MPAFIFDLDGTLIDSVFAHVLAWQQALEEADLRADGWRIHRRIGMSGGLLLHALSDELGSRYRPLQPRRSMNVMGTYSENRQRSAVRFEVQQNYWPS